MHISPPNLTSSPTGSGILFAEDFDDVLTEPRRADALIPEPPPLPPSLTDDDVRAARCEGFAAGRDAAMAEAALRLHDATRDALQLLAQSLPALADQRLRQIDEAVEVAARLIFTALAALLPSLALRHAPQEIAHLLHDVIADLAPDRALSLTVAPGLLDSMRTALADLPRDQARRVVLQGEESLVPGDARLSWEGGAAVRQTRPVLDSVTDILRSLDLLTQPAPNTRPAAVIPDVAPAAMETQHA